MTLKKNPKRRRLRADLSRVLINDLGGTSQVARLCRGLAPSTVSEWKNYGIPQSWVLYLRERFRDLPIMKIDEIANF